MEKKKIEAFEDLRVWQKGISLVKQVYLLTKEGDLSKDFGLRDQLRRASVEEGERLKGQGKRFFPFPFNLPPLTFFGEVRSLLRVALEVGYLDKCKYDELYSYAMDLSRMLSTQIQALNKSLQ